MKTIYLFLISVLVFSCKKQISPSSLQGTIETEINGVKKSFSVNIVSHPADNPAHLAVQGHHIESSGHDLKLIFSINDMIEQAPISAKSYQENLNPGISVFLMHDIEFSPGVFGSAKSMANTSNPLTITISQINEHTLKGIFYGDLRISGQNGQAGVIETLTNGVFDIQY